MGLHEGFPLINGLAKDNGQSSPADYERDSITSPGSAGVCLNAIQLLLFISKSWEMLSN